MGDTNPAGNLTMDTDLQGGIPCLRASDLENQARRSSDASQGPVSGEGLFRSLGGLLSDIP